MINTIIEITKSMNLGFPEILAILLLYFLFISFGKGIKFLAGYINEFLTRKEKIRLEEIEKKENEKRQELIRKRIEQYAQLKMMVENILDIIKDVKSQVVSKLDDIENELIRRNK